MTNLLAVIAFGVWSLSAPAIADEISAGRLESFCASPDGSFRRLCSLYILGVVQGIRLAAGELKDKTRFCIPDDVNEAQLVTIFQVAASGLKQNFPADMHEPAVSIVAAAVVHAFPCK